MYKRSESFFQGHDGTKLFLQKWTTSDAIGTILITHGQAEHSECYNRLVNGLEGQGWNFIGWDMRGHGRSEGVRGYAKDFDDYILDFRIFIDHCFKMPVVKGKPIVLLSHSMGGLVQTCALSEKNYPELTAQVLSSPLFGVAVEVPEWKDKGAGFINVLFPKVTLGNEIKNSDLTRDIEIVREFEMDTYRHGRISAGVYLGFKREFPKVLSYAPNITLPTLLHVSDKDPVVSSSAAIQFFDTIASQNKLLKLFEDGKHELYNDTVRAEVYQAVTDFLKQFQQ
jgi:lysophospholipase